MKTDFYYNPRCIMCNSEMIAKKVRTEILYFCTNCVFCARGNEIKKCKVFKVSV